MLKNASCGRRFPKCRTSSALGRFSSRVQTQLRTTRSEHCRPLSQEITLIGATRALWATVRSLLKEVLGSEQELSSAKEVAILPMRMGGWGCGPRPGVASWSDAFHIIHQQTMAELVVEAVRQEERPGASCLGRTPRCSRSVGTRRFLVEAQLGGTLWGRKTTSD